MARAGIDQSEGCSCRTSVADIGETHLLRIQAVRRKAIRFGRGSLKRPPSPLTWLDRIAASNKGVGTGPCECKSERDVVHLGRKAEGKPMEGALVRVLPSF
jgi:hypothetical protein